MPRKSQSRSPSQSPERRRDRDRDRSRDRDRDRRRARESSRAPAENRGGGPAAAEKPPEGMEGRLVAAMQTMETSITSKIDGLDRSLKEHVAAEIQKSEKKTGGFLGAWDATSSSDKRAVGLGSES